MMTAKAVEILSRSPQIDYSLGCDHNVVPRGFCGKHATMSGKNWRLVADEPVEVQDYRKFTDQIRGIYRIYLK